MDKLRCTIQHYAWGSRTAIAGLRGLATSEYPEAELWVGAHAIAPSMVCRDGGWLPLDEVITADPITELGARVAATHHGRLPFLAKILAAAQPLSLQTHPDEATAAAGFARENGSGLPLGARNRTYKDAAAKPEILVALTTFAGLCGFRPPLATAALLHDLGVEALRPVADSLQNRPFAGTLEQVVTDLFATPAQDQARLAQAVERAATAKGSRLDPQFRWLLDACRHFPGDIGLVVGLLLNAVELAPGEAIYLGAGNLHAYLHGMGVEVMGNSDNVVRAGLTDKHIDVNELLAVTDFAPLAEPTFSPAPRRTVPGGAITSFRPPTTAFCVDKIEVHGTVTLADDGPTVLVVTQGSVNGLGPTEAAFNRPGTTELVGLGTVWRVTAPNSDNLGQA